MAAAPTIQLVSSASSTGLILLMIFGHFLCDYPLQTDRIALGKCPGSSVAGVPWGYWMAGHCGTHALAVALLTGVPWLGAAEFGAHFIIDLLKCRKTINMAADQMLHLLCKLVWGISVASLA